MAYPPYDDSKPDASTQNGTAVFQSAKDNMNALRDALLAGAMSNWNWSVIIGTGTAEKPQYKIAKNGAQWIRLTITWGTTGGAKDNPQTYYLEYSSNSGSTWTPFLPKATLTITYDANGNVVGDPCVAWS